MNEKAPKQLSLLMDGELSDADSKDLIRALLSDRALRAAWERYHLISSILKSSIPTAYGRMLVDRVSDALSEEPTVLAPQWHVNRFVKPVAGFAIAASVAAVAVLTVQQNNSNVSPERVQQVVQHRPVTDGPGERPQQSAQPKRVVIAGTETPAQRLVQNPPVVTVSSSDSPQPVVRPQVTGVVTVESQPVIGPQWIQGQSAVASRLNSYLINHNEYGANIAMQGMLPYVRIVTYEPSE